MNLSSAALLDADSLGIDVKDVDPWVHARKEGAGVRLLRESGGSDFVRVTAVGDGVIRIRIGESIDRSILVPFQERDIEMDEESGRITAAIGDLLLAWDSDGGFHVGSLSRTSGDGSMGGPGLRSGAIVEDGRVVGWLERFGLNPYTQVFGGGESTQGPNLRDRARNLRNVETSGFSGYDRSYLNVPFLWSTEGWGLFVHTGAAVRVDIGATVSEVLSFVVDGPHLDLFYIAGTPGQILSQYLLLTGMPGELPSWALGTWLSRCSYFSEQELHDVLDAADASQTPVDVIHIDAWQQGDALADLACNWEMDSRRFPENWIDRLRDRDVRVSLWLNPYIPAGSRAAKEAAELGLFATTPSGGPAHTADIPGRLLLDFTNYMTLAWWRERIRELVLIHGASALKADFGEEIPDDSRMADGRTGVEIRNEYAHLYQEATRSAFNSALPEGETAAMFNRSGTAGSQRNPCHWVGDSASTWNGLVAALRAALSLSLSGFAWVSHDIGGFWSARRSADSKKVIADVDPELFLRWTQWGAFSPVMRFHGAGKREPFAYPGQYGELSVQACQMRGALREYLEASGREVSSSGIPVMRPMALSYPEYSEAHNSLQYLLGNDVLVAPVLQAGGKVRLWIPPGTWQQILGENTFEGPLWADLECQLHEFPAFVRCDPMPEWYSHFESRKSSESSAPVTRRVKGHLVRNGVGR